MGAQISSGSISELKKFILRIEETGKGKGRFAQRLSDRLDATKIPPYIQKAITYIIDKIEERRTLNNALEQIPEQ